MTRTRAAGRWAALVCALPLLAGCADEGGPPEPPPLRGAAEPGVAPPVAGRVPGMVLDIGTVPEGLVADGSTGLVVAALRDPGRLAVVSIAERRVLRTVSVPSTARHLSLAEPGGPVLVPGEDSDLLAEVEVASGRVLRTTRVGRQPHDAVRAAGGRLWAADEFGSSVSVVDTGRVVATIGGPRQPGGIAASGDRVVAVDVNGSAIFVYDAVAMTSLGTVPAGDGPTHVVADGLGRFVVADTRGNALLVYSAGPDVRLLTTVPLEGKPYGLAADPDRRRLWVALSETNRLVRFDLDLVDPTPRRGPEVATVQQPNSVAVDPRTGQVFVAGATASGTLQILPL